MAGTCDLFNFVSKRVATILDVVHKGTSGEKMTAMRKVLDVLGIQYKSRCMKAGKLQSKSVHDRAEIQALDDDNDAETIDYSEQNDSGLEEPINPDPRKRKLAAKASEKENKSTKAKQNKKSSSTSSSSGAGIIKGTWLRFLWKDKNRAVVMARVDHSNGTANHQAYVMCLTRRSHGSEYVYVARQIIDMIRSGTYTLDQAKALKPHPSPESRAGQGLAA